MVDFPNNNSMYGGYRYAMSKPKEDNGAGCVLMLGIVFLGIGLGLLFGAPGALIAVGLFFIVLGITACL